MARIISINANNPQTRLLKQAVQVINAGGIIVYPTDLSYALGCHIGDKAALQRLRKIKCLDASHHFTLVCRDLSSIGIYAQVDNPAYRFLKAHTPGPYTFILRATREVPRRLQNPKRKTIGIRIPDNIITQTLLEILTEPIMSTTLILPEEDLPLQDPYDIEQLIGKDVDLIIDGGYGGVATTTIIDMVDAAPSVIRQGLGKL